MASARVNPAGFVSAVLLRTLLLAALLASLVHLLLDTRYYATMLVVVLVAVFVIADLALLAARQHSTIERFLDSLSSGALETPLRREGMPKALRAACERMLQRLQCDRQQHLQRGEYLQTLLDTVPAGLLVMHTDGTVELMNRAAYQVLGESAPDLVSLPALGADAAAKLQGLAPGTHAVVQLAGGHRLLASAARFSAEGGSARRLISLQRLAGDLDAVSLAAWDDMARVLAHEMMNSLTPIASLSQSLDGMLRISGRTEEVAGALEAISRRSQGLMRFVEGYRKVADLPAPRPSTLALGPLLAGVEQLIGPSLSARGVALLIRVTPPDLTVHADPDQLEQSLINLLRNAADAVEPMDDAAIEVHCGVEEGRKFIEVRDNGRGLAPIEREQIFVPFYTTKPAGSGIGLSLARRIVQAHGGLITVRANAPRGTTLRITLPA